MYNAGVVSGWVEKYLFASLSDDVIGSTLLYMIVFLGVRQLLEEQKKFKKNEKLYEARIKKIDSFYSDLKKGLDEVMSKVQEVGKMWVLNENSISKIILKIFQSQQEHFIMRCIHWKV